MKPTKKQSTNNKLLSQYFGLMREAIEKKQELMMLFEELEKIKESLSFNLWRKYNTLMEKLGKKIHELPDIKQPSLYEYVTDDIALEIQRYRKLLARMDASIKLIYKTKDGIEHSKYYMLLRKFKKTKSAVRQLPQLPVFLIKKAIPYTVRRKIKHSIDSVVYLTVEQISPTLVDELQAWSQKRSNDSCDVIIFGITSFDYRMQRPQHLAMELVRRGHRVFYVENEFIPHGGSDHQFCPVSVKKKMDGLYIVKLSCPRNLFIYSDVPKKEEVETMMGSLKKLIYVAGIVNPIAKIDHPFWGCLQKKMSMRSLYDCMDEHTGFSDNNDNTAIMEDKLFENSDAVIVTSQYLKKKIEKKKIKRHVLIPNAGEFDHFEKSTIAKYPIPEDMKLLHGPIFGYYGAIADWFDVDLLDKASKTYPDASFVLIGRVMNDKIAVLAKKRSNIFLLGEKPYEELPAYLHAFDVCLIPFVLTDLIKATHPVKFFEYAASGKPIVTTALPELMQYSEMCYYAKTSKQFIEFLNDAVHEKNTKNEKKRIDLAKKETWDMRGKVLSDLIKEILFSKVSVVVLSYNNAEMTIQCLKSVIHRSLYPNVEVIVVDNDSNPKDYALVKVFCEENNCVLIHNKENLGFAKGNNIGMKKAKGEYIILLNNDTVVTPGWIERMIFHSKKKHVGLVGPATNNIGNEMRIPLGYDKKTLDGLEGEAQRYISLHWGEERQIHMLAAFCWLLPRTVYAEFGGLDEAYGRALFEDDDYCMHLKRSGKILLGIDDAFVHHYGSKAVDAIENSTYRVLFNKNKSYFEQKWNTLWVPHRLRNKKGKK